MQLKRSCCDAQFCLKAAGGGAIGGWGVHESLELMADWLSDAGNVVTAP